jgi:hypothetical protein
MILHNAHIAIGSVGQLLVVLMKQFIVFNVAIRTDPRSINSKPVALVAWNGSGIRAQGYWFDPDVT